MDTEIIDVKELEDTRAQAARALMWEREAERLAKYLWDLDPEHPHFSPDSVWAGRVQEWERQVVEDTGISPSPIDGISDAFDGLDDAASAMGWDNNGN